MSDEFSLILDDATLDPNGLLIIRGWAAGRRKLESVEIEVGGETIGRARSGGKRPDVANDHPGFVGAAESGFEFKRRVDETQFKGAKVFAVARFEGGGVRRVERAIAKTEAGPDGDPSQSLQLHFDEVSVFEDGAVRIVGWATHPDEIAAVEVRLEGQSIGLAELGLERTDVKRAHPELPNARRSGFRFKGRTEPPDASELQVALKIETFAGDAFWREQMVAPIAVEDDADPEQPIKLSIDAPAFAGGAFLQPVRRLLSIEGWSVARRGVAAIDVFIDGHKVASAIRGVRRLDIGAAFPDWPDALGAGFAIMLPRKLFTGERHTVRIESRDTQGRVTHLELLALVAAEDEDEQNPLRPYVPQAECDLKTRLIAAAPIRPAFIVGVAGDPGASAADEALAETLASLTAQAYLELRVVLWSDGAAITALTGLSLQTVATGREFDAALAHACDAVRDAGQAPYLLRLAPGDRLGADALLEFALTLASRPEIELLYADDRRRDPTRSRLGLRLKPEWAPDLLWSTNYIGRAWCASATLIERARLRFADLTPRGDYEIALRLTEAAREIARTPLVLLDQSEQTDGEEREMTALGRAMTRRRLEGGVRPTNAPGVYRVRRRVKTKGLVSVIIPTIASRGLIETCLATLKEKTLYRRVEFVCIDNISDNASPWKSWLRENSDCVVECLEPFNWARFNNLGAEAAEGEFLLFLNDDIEAVSPRWLHAMLEHAEREEVGAVGARLVYPDGRVQHASMFLSDRNGRHAFRFAEETETGPFGLGAAQREVSAVTGACLLVRRDAFNLVGGFEETHAIVNNDVDFCLKLRRAGKQIVYTPHALLVHHEMASRAALDDTFDESAFRAEWGLMFAAGDPFISPRLAQDGFDFAPDPEPVRVISTGRPLMRREDVRRILALKLDHVGDFVTALPALARLKERFPQAEIHVLAPAGSAPLARMSPAVTNVIEFNFFHAVSQEGRLETGDNEWKALEDKLRPFAFDLAIDLRKHIETRDVLWRTGARALAGFDHRGAFPWLDVALEWDGDQPYLHKRAYVGDDYVALVEAVSIACEEERGFLPAPAPQDARRALQALPTLVGLRPGLFDRDLVIVHPGSGNLLRQWPPRRFAELIDLILANFEVNVALIGAPSERSVVEETIEEIVDPSRVWSLVEKTRVSDLPALFAAARLFVGNNSGPHHIAAAAGTPTVGVHSHVVSAREWGPLGPNALALQREMSCGPCYLDSPARCSRGVACLQGLRAADVFRVCEQMLGARLRLRGGEKAETESEEAASPSLPHVVSFDELLGFKAGATASSPFSPRAK